MKRQRPKPQRPYRCRLCGVRFRRYWQKLAHEKAKHGKN